MTLPRYLQRSPTDPAGLRSADRLPGPLPYFVEPKDVLRLVEDIHGLLHEINGQMVDKGYERLEELLDPAGFSGLVSRAVVDKMGRLSKQLVRNEYHNGYPDLLPNGMYPRNRAQHGDTGGLEVKASRNEISWQSHGPRGGWFLIVQFRLVVDDEKALHDREPTQVLAAMIAELVPADWSWQPAKEGRIRSGTASVKASGAAKLRSGAVWVEPSYEMRQEELLKSARKTVLRERKVDVVRRVASETLGAISRDALYQLVADEYDLEVADVKNHVDQAIKDLIHDGVATRTGRGHTTEISLLRGGIVVT